MQGVTQCVEIISEKHWSNELGIKGCIKVCLIVSCKIKITLQNLYSIRRKFDTARSYFGSFILKISSMYNFSITFKYAYFLGNFRCEIDFNALLEIISNICVQGRCEILIGFLQLHAQNWMTLCFPGSAIHSLNNCLAHACMYLTNIFSLNYSLLIYVAWPRYGRQTHYTEY